MPKQTRNMDFFRSELGKNTGLARPDPLPELNLEERSREWRGALRAYDAVRLEMRIRTPGEIQRENSPFENFIPHIVGFNAAPRKQEA